MNKEYLDFLKNKQKLHITSGFNINETELNEMLFPFQKFIVKKALHEGKYAVFAACGTGKSPIQLEWANKVAIHTKKPVLILCPLAVSAQTIREGKKFNIEVCKYDGSDFPIQISNYEQLDNIDCNLFSGIVLDESSILKQFTGVYKKLIIEKFKLTPYKLACTATPSPNDLNEIGNHSEFLDVMDANDMRMRWFVRDEGMNNYRLKGHAEEDFFGWIGSWAIVLRTPSDIGFEDDGYILPPLNIFERIIETPKKEDGNLFNSTSVNATNFNFELRVTLIPRLEAVVDIVKNSNENFICWVKQNIEADRLQKLLPEAKEVRGSDSVEKKEFIALWFGDKGNECLCNIKEEKKNIKKNTIKCITQKTENQFVNEHHPELSKKEKQTLNTKNKKLNIVENTIKTIKKNLIDSPQSLEKKETHVEEKDTIQTMNTKNVLNCKQEKQENEIQKQTLNINLKHNMDLPLNSTKNYLIPKIMDVQFVEQNQLYETVNKDCMLTTAIKQEKLEDCCVQTVITDLENLKIQKYCLNVPLCTYCGGTLRKILISKSKIFSFGLNFQNCNNQIFSALDFSFESLHQSIRRSYRFGQKNEVNIYLITTDTMENVIASIRRKEKTFNNMITKIVHYANNKEFKLKVDYEKKEEKNDNYWIINGDSCIEMDYIANDSIDFSVFSPPFSTLFTYSDNIRDLGNCANHEEFYENYKFILKSLYRIMKPGRLIAVHSKDMAVYKNSSGYSGLYDFTGRMHRLIEDVGFKYHSKVIIWLDPVLEMQRTKTQRLLYKQVTSDSSYSGIGMPEYITIFRKWEGNEEDWTPITNLTKKKFSLDTWQKWASPVWFDIKRTDVLNNYKGASEKKDEKHIAPLQIGVIERCIAMWSNEGETVFTPFMGIGSEVYQAVKMGRKGIGIELKNSYYELAKKNLENVVKNKQEEIIFEEYT